MENNKDKSERLKYLNKQKQLQENKKRFYLDNIGELKRFLLENQKEIKYNEGWIGFHEKSIERHKEKIQTGVLDEKQNQEEKLNFHMEQIENHHRKNINYHEKEIEFIEREIKLFEEGINKCKEQLDFLNNKIRLI